MNIIASTGWLVSQCQLEPSGRLEIERKLKLAGFSPSGGIFHSSPVIVSGRGTNSCASVGPALLTSGGRNCYLALQTTSSWKCSSQTRHEAFHFPSFKPSGNASHNRFLWLCASLNGENESTEYATVEAEDSFVSGAEVMQQLAGAQTGQDLSRKEVMHEAIQRLAGQDIETAAVKYNLEEELFAEIDFARINAFTATPFGGNPAAVCYLPMSRDDKWMQLIAREFNLSETAFLVKRRAPKAMAASASTDESSGKKGSRGFGNKPLIEKDALGQGVKPVKKMAAQAAVSNEFDLRWFTPKGEVRLCGHATLASAHLLFAAGLVEGDVVRFHTKSGVLQARKVEKAPPLLTGQHPPHASTPASEQPSTFPSASGAATARSAADANSLKAQEKGEEEGKGVGSGPGRGGGRGVYELEFPLEPVTVSSDAEQAHVREAFPGVAIKWIGRSTLDDIVVEVGSEAEVRGLRPDAARLASLEARGVSVTAAGGEGSQIDFVSRFFAPRHGIEEDPVTGSLHCSLGPYWAAKLGKDSLLAYQASERGGQLVVRVDQSSSRVHIQGSAVMVMAGVLMNTAVV